MMRHLLVPVLLLALRGEAQKAGSLIRQVHPSLSWKRCGNDTAGAATCETVNGKVVVDAGWRWVHRADSFFNCYTGNSWDREFCSTNDACTAGCVVEGTDAAGLRETFGVVVDGGRLSQRVATPHASGTTLNSRVFLLEEGAERYQTFTLMGNELAFDVDVSSVGCSINSALYFVAMDPDGGRGRYPTNQAGARYGTGYCDASCSRGNRFVGGKARNCPPFYLQANAEGWVPLDETRGEGDFGACCSEFDVWLGNKSFYGKGKTVDTDKKITLDSLYPVFFLPCDFFVQDGKRIDAPAPAYAGFPDESGISPGHCRVLPFVFGEANYFEQVGGYHHHNEALRRPMVLAMSISDDYWTKNLWLDSTYPVDGSGPGTERGDCPRYNGGPTLPVEPTYDSKVAWSNIRFGPIGTTV
ncbi:putative exoglucanase 1 [Colletotrichum sublineola]|uniref:Glucanase n=1 Tax=Colletotrichum sublineola TaxID=1173701 RepID=A0A066XPR3_COLSU|nr:putative exoglucanase 1 [Colletotrichum sublineola]